MKINRQEFLGKLKSILSGVSKTETLEQSNCFVFSDNMITAFNGEVFAATEFQFDNEFAVNANDIVQLLSRIPDEEIAMVYKDSQLIISGKKKRAGLVTQQEILLPIDTVPRPEKMRIAKKDFLKNLQMAAKICATTNENHLISHVHVTPNIIESTDRYRFLRIQMDTGAKEMLIPATAILSVNSMHVTHIELVKNWLFLKNQDKKIMIAVCCGEGEYFKSEMLESVCAIKNANTIQLPEEVGKMIDRSSVMTENSMEKEAQIVIDSSSITIKTQKESGWYEEKQKIKYEGEEIKMTVNLSLLKDILSKTNKAIIGDGKIKMEEDNMEFVVSLEK